MLYLVHVVVRARLAVARVLRQLLPPAELLQHAGAAAEGRRGIGARGDALERVGERGESAAGGLCVEGERLPVDVVDGVAGQVVARVVLALAGEDGRGRDAELDETGVVGPGVELGVRDHLAVGLEVVGQQLGPDAAVVVRRELVDGVGRRDHVVVEVVLDLVGLLRAEVLGVVVRAHQAGLFGRPPREADLVGEPAVLLDGSHQLQQAGGAGAVVVDAGTLEHAVEMGPEHDDLVRVALLGLGNDVPRLALLKDGVDDERHGDLVALGEGGAPGLARLERDDAQGHEEANVLGAERGLDDVVAGDLVVQDHAEGAGGLCVLDLVGDGADAALDEGELSGGVDALERRGQAPGAVLVVDGDVDEGRGDAARQGGGGVVLGADDDDVHAVRARDGDGVGLLKGVVERLEPGVHLLGETRLGALQDEVDRGLVSRRAKGASAAVVAADLVQVPENALKPCAKEPDSLDGLDVGLDLVGSEKIDGQGGRSHRQGGGGGGKFKL
ncbi:hypothetical protein CTA1_11184 [Colletotrichum tanaceti]|uniref:Uncharacterized protein n=1 Tax=Colletotrichum tanaceti TaxID=1306861 RepID=A0A4U6X4A8_9PEZI|nr:hypothetical protein CTA1_11184 [Colletotrichum tanaceti]